MGSESVCDSLKIAIRILILSPFVFFKSASSRLPSNSQSQSATLSIQRLEEKKELEIFDEFVAETLPLVEAERGQEVTVEEFKQVRIERPKKWTKVKGGIQMLNCQLIKVLGNPTMDSWEHVCFPDICLHFYYVVQTLKLPSVIQALVQRTGQAVCQRLLWRVGRRFRWSRTAGGDR